MTVTLDWSRPRKRFKELPGMALRSEKANFPIRYEVKKRLFRMLRADNVEAACGHLESLDEMRLKCRTRLEELVRYPKASEPQIACRTVRRALGLRISSNRAGKANDLVVSSRQRHDGTG